MIGKEKIEEMKKAGEVVISPTTLKKRVVSINSEGKSYIEEGGEFAGWEYKGVIYNTNDWLFTYGHEQFIHLYNR